MRRANSYKGNPELPERVRELAPDGIDVYMDCGGASDLPAAVAVLAERGRIVLPYGTQQPVLPVGRHYSRRQARSAASSSPGPPFMSSPPLPVR